jgi:hypothetical protein
MYWCARICQAVFDMGEVVDNYETAKTYLAGREPKQIDDAKRQSLWLNCTALQLFVKNKNESDRKTNAPLSSLIGFLSPAVMQLVLFDHPELFDNTQTEPSKRIKNEQDVVNAIDKEKNNIGESRNINGFVVQIDFYDLLQTQLVLEAKALNKDRPITHQFLNVFYESLFKSLDGTDLVREIGTVGIGLNTKTANTEEGLKKIQDEYKKYVKETAIGTVNKLIDKMMEYEYKSPSQATSSGTGSSTSSLDSLDLSTAKAPTQSESSTSPQTSVSSSSTSSASTSSSTSSSLDQQHEPQKGKQISNSANQSQNNQTGGSDSDSELIGVYDDEPGTLQPI